MATPVPPPASPRPWRRGTIITGLIAALLVFFAVLGATGVFSSSPKAASTKPVINHGQQKKPVTRPAVVTAPPSNLGNFNPANHPTVQTAPLGEIGPGACWPARTFANKDGAAQAVTYLSGKDPRDTAHTSQGVAARDEAWFAQHTDYYGYTVGQSDAAYTQGLVEEQLPYPITVQNTYCPQGQDVVKLWKVQTLPVGEWVFFKKGHAPSDLAKSPALALIPVKKAVCGNNLLPVPVATPVSPAPQPPTSPVAPQPQPTTPPVVTTTPPPPPATGKYVQQAPPVTRETPGVQPPSGGYVDRNGGVHSNPYVPPPAPPASAGAGSGPGAISTTAPPATSAPPAAVPTTTSPTSNPVMP
jgi:hypothetical protein